MKLRSILFSPADKPERVRKVLESGAADVVVADLEDGVSPDNKTMAREAAAALYAEVASAPAVRAVRINAWPGSLAEQDLEAVLPSQPDLLVVPKAEDPSHIEALDARLSESGAPDTRLLLILETAKGILNAADLAACPRVVAVAFGAEDLSADVGIRRTPDNANIAVPRAMVPIAAAAAGVQAIDMITADYQDTDRCQAEAGSARDLGYAGKMCIHPVQLEPVHQAFAPSEAELAWANKVVDAANAEGITAGGVITVDGQMIDVPLVEQAKRLLAAAEP